MVKRLIALFLLVNVVGVVANLPRIIQALDGAEVGERVSEWAVGVGTASGDFLDEANENPLTEQDVARIQEDLRNDTLDDPLDDESVAALVELWRVLEAAGAQLQADDLRDLLVEEGIDPAQAGETSAPVPRVSARPVGDRVGQDDVERGELLGEAPVEVDPSAFDDEGSRSALDALRSGDGLGGD